MFRFQKSSHKELHFNITAAAKSSIYRHEMRNLHFHRHVSRVVVGAVQLDKEGGIGIL